MKKEKKEKKTTETKASAKGFKETVTKITEKVPAWLRRVQSELAKLVVLIEKAQAAIEKLEAALSVGKLLKKDRETLRLLRKQVKAMNAYKAVLEERIRKAQA